MSKLASALIIFYLVHPLSWGTTINSLPLTDNVNAESRLSSVISSGLFVPTGEATFSILFWDLYTASLKTTYGKYPISLEKEQLIFHIDYFADISNEDLIDRTIEQWQHQKIPKEIYSPYIEQLSSIWPNISKGDSLAILVQAEQSVFYFNDQYIGVIKDNAFGRLFVDIWLDKKTSEPSMRAKLLGENINE